jgi:uncharacterized membrane protein
MASLVAITYPDHATAEAAFETVKGLETAGYLTVMEQALVRKNEQGNISVDEEKHPVRRAALAGGVIGAIAGTMFFVPVAGAAVGAAIGGVFGRENRSGGQDDFEEFSNTVKQNLPNGGAALVVLGATDAKDRVIQNLGRHGGTVSSFDFPDVDLARIQREVDRAAGK